MARYAFTVDDLTYYRAEESAIRLAMKRFETGLFPLANQAVMDAAIEVENYPKEAYYCETAELAGFFDRIRTLQNRFTSIVTPAIRELHEIYSDPIFGIKAARATALNPYDVYYKKGDPLHPSQLATIPTMVDSVTVASDKTAPEWSVEKIMKAIDIQNLGINLVGLAITVDQENREKEGTYNPLATCMACESTVLSREIGLAMASPQKPEVEWKVSPEVDEYGRKLVDDYKALFHKHSRIRVELPYVTPENAEELFEDSPSMIRCVNLNADFLTGRPDPYYHWAIRYVEGHYSVLDFFADRIITTQEWRDKRENGF